MRESQTNRLIFNTQICTIRQRLFHDFPGAAINNPTRKLFSDTVRATLGLRLFGFARIPLMLYVRPTVKEISNQRVVVRIPLIRRTRNHLGSMYFGALGIGADCAVGALAMHLIKQQSVEVSLIFRTFSAEFHQRAEGDVDFCCTQGNEIANLVAQASATDQRVEMGVDVIATVPDRGDDPVATFRLTLSMKRRP
jgi:acyl-coenzyme A thioesterase PaaI-like protein